VIKPRRAPTQEKASKKDAKGSSTPAPASGSRAHKQKIKKDPRITKPSFSWREFLLMWFAIMVVGSGEDLILNRFAPIADYLFIASAAAVAYRALMAFLIVLVITLLRRFTYERPIRLLGAALRHVAEGDFSVRLPVSPKIKKKTYMNVIFEDFNTMAEELASIETLKDDFVGNVSHEIKTPLAVIENYATYLQKQKLTKDERSEYTKTIAEATKRLSLLVSNILRLSKLENQEIVPMIKPYDLSEQLRHCLLGFEPAWEEKNLTLEVDIEDECIINYDETLLELVWNNLLSNAIKFSEQSGTVKVSQRSLSGETIVCVSDSGLGMDGATMHRVFDKFYQGDTSHAHEGNGLGLALAARALKLSAGEISLISAPFEGTTFTVRLGHAT
jgi:signal transduction histidine kinase